MKKLLILALSTLCVMALFTGCSNDGDDFEAQSYSSEGEKINSVSIDVRDKEIEVSLSSDDFVHLDYFESNTEYYDISVSDNGVLTMNAKSDKGLVNYFGIKFSDNANKISLQIPGTLLSTLELSTTNEDISLSDLTVADSISLSNNNGDISFDKLNVGNALTVENKNGNISGSVVGSYEDYTISCSLKKGESNLPNNTNGGVKTLNVTNNNGDVAIDFVSE